MSSELEAARNGALLIAHPGAGTLVVHGPDAAPWLNGLLTCDVKNLRAGEGAWSLALTKQGKIQSELNVLATERGLYCSTAPDTTEALFQAFQDFLIMEDAELENRSGDTIWLAAHGPRSGDVLEAARARNIVSAAIDWTGLGGAALALPRPELDSLIAALEELPGVKRGTADSWERLRIERVVPAFGMDFGAQDNPHEASLDRRAVSWTKGCYLGQEVVCMQDMRGKVKRRVVGVQSPGLDVLAPHTAVLAGAEPVGEITSSCAADDLGACLALARLTTKAIDAVKQASVALTAGGRPLSLRD